LPPEGTIAEAEAEAARIRAEAEQEAAELLDAARRRADAFADARIGRLRELTDRLVATAETVEQRFGQATEVKAQLDDLVAALGAAAERAAREQDAPAPESAPASPRATVRVLDAATTASRRAVS